MYRAAVEETITVCLSDCGGKAMDDTTCMDTCLAIRSVAEGIVVLAQSDRLERTAKSTCDFF